MYQKIKYLLMAMVLTCATLTPPTTLAQAESCPDLRIIFARGSGGVRWEDQNYLEFRSQIDGKLSGTGINYEFIDLDYPAVGVGIDNLAVAVGALFSGGESYEFGASVDAGVNELKRIVNDAGCQDTKYVLGGYSQGAMVVSKSLGELMPDRIIFAATFGDPKLFLPEGAGLMPEACRNRNLSDYRMYVPDCYAFKGLLGAYIPYRPEDFAGKVGTWCNKRDIFCSSRFSISDHVSYISDNLYEDASRVIASKVTKAFGVVNEYTSPHDTAILIDSSGSMTWLLEQTRTEIIKLANETFAAGGRVALYDYRDLNDPYDPRALCDFDTCNAENFQWYLYRIIPEGGGDDKESLLSASVRAMSQLTWRPGATKSLVVLTDSPFLSPDRDATTMADVIELSKSIDPVNMYIVSCLPASADPDMIELAEATGGFVTSNYRNFDPLIEYVMERYDALPRVEEEAGEGEFPTIEVVDIIDDGNDVTLTLGGTATKAIVIANDTVLGISEDSSITIRDLDRDVNNTLRLVPANESLKGAAIDITIVRRLPVWSGEQIGEVEEPGGDPAGQPNDTEEPSSEPVEQPSGTEGPSGDSAEQPDDAEEPDDAGGQPIATDDSDTITLNGAFVDTTEKSDLQIGGALGGNGGGIWLVPATASTMRTPQAESDNAAIIPRAPDTGMPRS